MVHAADAAGSPVKVAAVNAPEPLAERRRQSTVVDLPNWRMRWKPPSTGGVRACLRRVAGCATPRGSAGHAGATANLKLTFRPDHSTGAVQFKVEVRGR